MREIVAAEGNNLIFCGVDVRAQSDERTGPFSPVVIRLCNDVIDEMKGAREVATGLEQELGIRFGETTPDGKLTIEAAECLGACEFAPCMLVGEDVHRNLDEEIAA